MYHLKCSNHLQNLSQQFTNIYSSSALADVTLSCRDGTIKAHKLVLSACSPYFEQIFKDNSCQHLVVFLKGIPFSEIKLLVEFMYKGSVDVQKVDLQSLMDTASELEIRGLVNEPSDNAAQSLNMNLVYPTRPATMAMIYPATMAMAQPATGYSYLQSRTYMESLHQASHAPVSQPRRGRKGHRPTAARDVLLMPQPIAPKGQDYQSLHVTDARSEPHAPVSFPYHGRQVHRPSPAQDGLMSIQQPVAAKGRDNQCRGDFGYLVTDKRSELQAPVSSPRQGRKEHRPSPAQEGLMSILQPVAATGRDNQSHGDFGFVITDTRSESHAPDSSQQQGRKGPRSSPAQDVQVSLQQPGHDNQSRGDFGYLVTEARSESQAPVSSAQKGRKVPRPSPAQDGLTSIQQPVAATGRDDQSRGDFGYLVTDTRLESNAPVSNPYQGRKVHRLSATQDGLVSVQQPVAAIEQDHLSPQITDTRSLQVLPASVSSPPQARSVHLPSAVQFGLLLPIQQPVAITEQDNQSPHVTDKKSKSHAIHRPSPAQDALLSIKQPVVVLEQMNQLRVTDTRSVLMRNLPYKAEYAKTEMNICKGCQQKIPEGALCIAIKTKSSIMYHKRPNWHHEECFFKKRAPKSVAEIENFKYLKIDDQKRIKQAIESSTRAVRPKHKSRDKAKKRAADDGCTTTLKDFHVEYSNNSRATCRFCKNKILQDEVRIAKIEPISMFGGINMWYHVKCFAKERNALSYFAGGESLPGFNSLNKDDQAMIQRVIKPYNVDDIPPKKHKDVPKDGSKLNEEREKVEKRNKQRNSGIQKIKNEPTDESELNEETDSASETELNEEIELKYEIDIEEENELKDESELKEEKEKEEKTKIKDEPKDQSELSEENEPKDEYELNEENEPKDETELNEGKQKEQNVEKQNNQYHKPKALSELNEDKEPKDESGPNEENEPNDESEPNEENELKDESELNEEKKKDEKVVKQNNLFHKQNALCEITKGDLQNLLQPATRIPEDVKVGDPIPQSDSMDVNSEEPVKLKEQETPADPESKLADVAHVYTDEGGDKYSVVLFLERKNYYYKIQVLEANDRAKYWFFRSFGRPGSKIGGTKLEECPTASRAVSLFENLYLEKTKDLWDFRHNFKKAPGTYYPLDLDSGGANNTTLIKKDDLPEAVQKLVLKIFNVEVMKQTLKELELDIYKMPLEKLSKDQIKEGYKVLSELINLIENKSRQNDIIYTTNRFFTLIPHDFGGNNAPLLDNMEIIKTKTAMLDNLLEIELAFSLLNTDSKESNPISAHYLKLKAQIIPLPAESPEYDIIRQYVTNTHVDSSYMLSIEQVFKVVREGEDDRFERFKKFRNRRLLWHGSRVSSFAGIISQGLRIAPPEAPASGYNFGKGVYFTDMVSKSVNDCCVHRNNPSALLLLCDVALGNMKQCTRAEDVKLPSNMLSAWGMGSVQPGPAENKILDDGLIVPLGTPVQSNINTSLLFNEFVVYDVAQVNVKYLIQLKFNYDC